MVVTDEQYAIPAPVETAERFELSREVPMPESPFEAAAEQPTVQQEPEVADDRVRVLVVDDSQTARKLIAGRLEASGYNVLSAADGREAVHFAKTAGPALALVDIGMPMMDGYAVCRSLRDEPATHDIPVLLISGKDGYFEEDRGSAGRRERFHHKAIWSRNTDENS